MNSFICEICARSLSHQRLLTNHLKTHYPSFACKACHKLFRTKKNLQRHEKCHEKKKSLPKSKTLSLSGASKAGANQLETKGQPVSDDQSNFSPNEVSNDSLKILALEQRCASLEKELLEEKGAKSGLHHQITQLEQVKERLQSELAQVC